MYFMVFGSDKPAMESVRAAARPAHRDYLRNPGKHAVTVRVAGPTLRDDGVTMNGTLLIVEAEDLASVRSFVADDPYSRAGLFASVEIRPWNWGLNNPPSDV
ncbi:MAG TPA: YciI family protein [Burkholderiales bacterium]|jgi:hypothetical protein